MFEVVHIVLIILFKFFRKCLCQVIESYISTDMSDDSDPDEPTTAKTFNYDNCITTSRDESDSLFSWGDDVQSDETLHSESHGESTDEDSDKGSLKITVKQSFVLMVGFLNAVEKYLNGDAGDAEKENIKYRLVLIRATLMNSAENFGYHIFPQANGKIQAEGLKKSEVQQMPNKSDTQPPPFNSPKKSSDDKVKNIMEFPEKNCLKTPKRRSIRIQNCLDDGQTSSEESPVKSPVIGPPKSVIRKSFIQASTVNSPRAVRKRSTYQYDRLSLIASKLKSALLSPPDKPPKQKQEKNNDKRTAKSRDSNEKDNVSELDSVMSHYNASDGGSLINRIEKDEEGDSTSTAKRRKLQSEEDQNEFGNDVLRVVSRGLSKSPRKRLENRSRRDENEFGIDRLSQTVLNVHRAVSQSSSQTPRKNRSRRRDKSASGKNKLSQTLPARKTKLIQSSTTLSRKQRVNSTESIGHNRKQNTQKLNSVNESHMRAEGDDTNVSCVKNGNTRRQLYSEGEWLHSLSAIIN